MRRTAARTSSSKSKSVASSAAAFIPPKPTLRALRAAAAHCRGCHLYKVGTQTVFGEGPSRSAIVIVGEQPGDAEDRAGKPFVGPSGKLLDRALDGAGIAREDVYVTNAVKHFKWARDSRSGRRIHNTPNAAEVHACHPWLEHELAVIRPRVIICLGATAAKSLLGAKFSVTKQRGRPIRSVLPATVFATVHPSAVLRAPREVRARNEQAFLADIRAVARFIARDDAKAPAERRAGSTAGKLAAWPTTGHPSATSSAPTRSSPR